VIPPLRNRADDLEDLVPHFIEEVNRDEGTEVDGIDSECLATLRAYSWPGNVRELRNVLHQTVVNKGRGRIRLQDLPEEILSVRHQEDRFEVPRWTRSSANWCEGHSRPQPAIALALRRFSRFRAVRFTTCCKGTEFRRDSKAEIEIAFAFRLKAFISGGRSLMSSQAGSCSRGVAPLF
jgi:DNA-binding NtrC family response regulator